jgi:hypothetical protein
VIGTPEISTDGLHFYKPANHDAFGSRVAHGVVQKTYPVTHLNVNEASRRYSPAAVIAVEYDVVSGVPAEISTSYVERQNLMLRMALKAVRAAQCGFQEGVVRRPRAFTVCVSGVGGCLGLFCGCLTGRAVPPTVTMTELVLEDSRLSLGWEV